MSKMNRLKTIVKAPASIANLGPGFDILAMAIEGLYDVVEVEVSDGEGIVDVKTEGIFSVPEGPENVAYRVAKSFLDYYSITNIDLRIKVVKGVPPASGLGSSGATSAATAYALAKLLRKDINESELLRLAAEGEALVAGTPHYDNVAASLFGNIVLIDLDKGKVYKIEPRIPIYIAVVLPKTPLRTDKKTGLARSVIPKSIDLHTHVKQQSSLAKLIYALMVGDIKLFGEAISADFVVEHHRAKLIPYYYELKELALKLGALGFNISGAGPSTFFVHKSYKEALSIGEKLISFLKDKGVNSDLLVTRISDKGSEVIHQ
uniref:Homoserine kinase n=1 Tax=Ignisphaera aggregans TaxID=334771 RepID=A0A7C4NMT9_9CREN